MPHCIIEYSSDLSDKVNDIMDAVYTGACSSQLFEEEDIKTRAIAYENYQVGSSSASFIHVSSKILSGRSSAQKAALNHTIVSHIADLGITNCAITAEVIDIDKESYIKQKR